MKENKITILGANGIIGQTLVGGLNGDYQINLFDILPNKSLNIKKINALNINELTDAISDSRIVINLAWDVKNENHRNNNFNPDNFKIAENVYKVCKNSNVSRLIIASSVHCHDFQSLIELGYINKIDFTTPSNPISFYGKDKVEIEKLGKKYSKYYEIICVRFGGIEKKDMRFWNEEVGLTHSDCINLIKHIIGLKKIKNNFQIVYGLSKNENSIFNIKNDINWKPKSDLTEYYKK